MLYLLSNVLIDKYYPSTFTQFAVGTIFYVLAYLIMREIISMDTYNEYQYHMIAVIIIDVAYLLNNSRQTKETFEVIHEIDLPEIDTETDVHVSYNTETDTDNSVFIQTDNTELSLA